MVIVGGEENFDVVGDWTLEYVECLVGAKIESYFNKKRGTEGDGVATEEGKRDYDEDTDKPKRDCRTASAVNSWVFFHLYDPY